MTRKLRRTGLGWKRCVEVDLVYRTSPKASKASDTRYAPLIVRLLLSRSGIKPTNALLSKVQYGVLLLVFVGFLNMLMVAHWSFAASGLP